MSKTSIGRYSVCPFDPQICGSSRSIQLDESGSSTTITATGHAESADFIFGQVCNYELFWPETAKDKDQITVSVIEKADGNTLYVGQGSDGLCSTDSLKENIMQSGTTLLVDYPTKVIITAKSSEDGQDSTFQVTVRFVAAPVEQTEEEETPPPEPTID